MKRLILLSIFISSFSIADADKLRASREQFKKVASSEQLAQAVVVFNGIPIDPRSAEELALLVEIGELFLLRHEEFYVDAKSFGEMEGRYFDVIGKVEGRPLMPLRNILAKSFSKLAGNYLDMVESPSEHAKHIAVLIRLERSDIELSWSHVLQDGDRLRFELATSYPVEKLVVELGDFEGKNGFGGRTLLSDFIVISAKVMTHVDRSYFTYENLFEPIPGFGKFLTDVQERFSYYPIEHDQLIAFVQAIQRIQLTGPDGCHRSRFAVASGLVK